MKLAHRQYEMRGGVTAVNRNAMHEPCFVYMQVQRVNNSALIPHD